MHDLVEEEIRLCYSEFRKHCMQLHNLHEWDTDAQAYLDVENWLLTLVKS